MIVVKPTGTEVLRDVAVQMQPLVLLRPSGRKVDARASAGNSVGQAHNPAQVGAMADALRGAAGSHGDESFAGEAEVTRRGYEAGFAQGLIEARAQSEARAAEAVRTALEKADLELLARSKRLEEELRQQAVAAYQERVKVLEALIAALPSKIADRLAEAEDEMIALCFTAVARILGEQSLKPEMVRAQIAHARSVVRGRPLMAIHLHPQDLAEMEMCGFALVDRMDGAQWIASADVALGGCILQSAEGGLDFRLETQMQELRDMLLQTRAAAVQPASSAASNVKARFALVQTSLGAGT